MSRIAGGIIGIKLKRNDIAIDITHIDNNTKNILVITENGYDIKDIEPKAKEIANKWLDNIMEVQKMIVEGKVNTV